MTIDFQKVAGAIEKSSKEIKDLMFSTELGDKIGEIAETNKLEEEVAFKLIDEVGYVILDLKSRSTFFDSLVEIGIEKNMALTIAKEVETKIFSELDKIKNKASESTEPVTESAPPKPAQNNVGTSFEQIILNQAKAMMPARVAVAPENLPIERPVEGEGQHPPKHDYSAGNDPYREPTN